MYAAKFANLEPDLDPNPVASVDKTSEGTGAVGTYFYTAPEISQGWPHIDEKVLESDSLKHPILILSSVCIMF